MPEWLPMELAAQNAWPALRTERYDGWVLRYARGYTRRANSINPLAPSALPLADKVACCLRRYEAAKIEPAFRIVDRGPALEVDEWLAAHGWQQRDLTLTLGHELCASQVRALPLAGMRLLERGEWLKAYVHITADSRDQSAHAEILQRIGTRGARLAIWRAGEPVACALAVLSDTFVALVDLAVHTAWRRQGIGRALVQQALAWGVEQGATLGLLQVVAANEPARRLYAGLGWAPVYSYWYRQLPSAEQRSEH